MRWRRRKRTAAADQDPNHRSGYAVADQATRADEDPEDTLADANADAGPSDENASTPAALSVRITAIRVGKFAPRPLVRFGTAMRAAVVAWCSSWLRDAGAATIATFLVPLAPQLALPTREPPCRLPPSRLPTASAAPSLGIPRQTARTFRSPFSFTAKRLVRRRRFASCVAAGTSLAAMLSQATSPFGATRPHRDPIQNHPLRSLISHPPAQGFPDRALRSGEQLRPRSALDEGFRKIGA
jgi:hypothetical protein